MSRPPRRELEDIQNAFEDVLERAERMKRTSSADDLSTTVNDLRRLSERLRETSASRKSEGRELARQMAQRSWNFSIEKTALETKADTGVINDSYFSHLLDLRYASCELLDHALGLADVSSPATVWFLPSICNLGSSITRRSPSCCIKLESTSKLKSSF